MAVHPIEALYRAHSRALLVHCTHRLGNAAQARDAVQDAFERVMKAYARELIDEAHAAAYLFRTATNICFDILRHQTVWRKIAPEFVASAARANRVEPQHMHRDFAREVFSRIGPLTVSVGLMHFVEGMSQQEIATEVGLSRRSVFNHIKKLERHVFEIDGETSRHAGGLRRARATRAAIHAVQPLGLAR